MNSMSFIRRLSAPRFGLPVTGMLLGISAALLSVHAMSVNEMRELGLPAAMNLPVLEKRAAMLTEQNDLIDLQSMLGGGSKEEYLRMYVVPDAVEVERIVASFDALFTLLEEQNHLYAVSPLTIGDPEVIEGSDDINAVPITFNATLTQEGLAKMSLFIDLSGLLTVADALGEEGINRLLDMTEQKDPSSVTALERFLSADLLRYCDEPEPYLKQLRSALASDDTIAVIDEVVHAPRIQQAQELMADLSPVLHKNRLWPLRFLTVDHTSVKNVNGSLQATFSLEAYVRED